MSTSVRDMLLICITDTARHTQRENATNNGESGGGNDSGSMVYFLSAKLVLYCLRQITKELHQLFHIV